MKIKNVGADRRYYYTPYELTALVTEGKDSKSVSVMDDFILDDGSFTAYGYSGEHSYTVTSLKNQVKRYPTLVMMLSKQLDKGQLTSYEAQESRYNSWVYDNGIQEYRKIPAGSLRTIPVKSWTGPARREARSIQTGEREDPELPEAGNWNTIPMWRSGERIRTSCRICSR